MLSYAMPRSLSPTRGKRIPACYVMCPWPLVLAPCECLLFCFGLLSFSLIPCHWSLVRGPWSLGLRPWTLVPGPCSLVRDPFQSADVFVVFGLSSFIHPLSLVLGVAMAIIAMTMAMAMATGHGRGQSEIIVSHAFLMRRALAVATAAVMVNRQSCV